MKNASFHSSFAALILVALAFGAFSPPGMAMDASNSDMDPHLSYLKKVLNEHGFHPCHFCLAEKDQSVKLFNLQEHTRQRIQDTHESHLKNYPFKSTPQISATQATSAYSSWWDMLPSMPSFWSKTTPTPDLEHGSTEILQNAGLNDSSPLTISDFYLVPTSDSESSPILPTAASTTVLQPSSVKETSESVLPTSSTTTVLEPSFSYDSLTIIDNYSRRSLETEPIELGLSLMGGGGRGYMTALWLKHLIDKTKAPIWQIFPCIAGVSIGAILGLGLANPKIKISEFDRFFTTDFDQVFPQEGYWNFPVKIWDSARSILYPQYSAEPLEALLHGTNGNTTMNEMLTDVVATAINTRTNELRTFSRDTDGIVPVWEVQRASSAAPTKFKAYEIDGIPYIDGGIGENNPVLRLLIRMRELSQQRKQSFNLDTATVLSLGTGEMPVDSIPNNAGLSSAGRIINACMDVQSNAAEKTAQSLVKNFVSINPKLSRVIPLDTLNDEIRALLREAAETKYEDIEKFADLDVVQRQLERAVY